MRAAIYARFSTDLQRDRSIEDQLALCRSHAERLGASVVREFADRARSGASVFGRQDLLEMLDQARAGAFDVIIVEALDRLSRDQEDLAGIYKRMTFSGVRLEAVHDGQADAVQIGVRGMLGSLFLADLSHKTRRGLTGVVRDGRIAGGKAYGYRPTPSQRGAYEIVPEEAAVIRRIFDDYLAGKSVLKIATELNAEGIPAPRGPIWRTNTISGHNKRGYGILQNRLYVGEIVWNKTRFVRDPDTGKRTSRLNPESEWQFAEAPHLAIIDRETFDAVNGIKKERAFTMTSTDPDRPRIRKKHLFAGLLHCAECGAGMPIRASYKGRSRIQCSRAIESTACSNRQTLLLDRIENAVLEKLAESLQSEEAMNAYLDEYFAEMKRLTSESRKRRDVLLKRKTDLEGSINRMIDLVIRNVVTVDAASERIPELKTKLAETEAELQAAEADVPSVALHPEAIASYRQAIDRLRESLADPDAREMARDAINRLIGRITIKAGDNDTVIEIHGKLAALLGETLPPSLSFRVVAGTRFASERQTVAWADQLILIGVIHRGKDTFQIGSFR